jgi:hypothetical protein
MPNIKNWKQLNATEAFKAVDKLKKTGSSWENIASDLNKKKVRRERQSKTWSANATREFYYRERQARGASAPKRGRPKKETTTNKPSRKGTRQPTEAKNYTVSTREQLYEEITNLRKNDFDWENIAKHFYQNGIVHEMWTKGDKWTGDLVQQYFRFCEFYDHGGTMGLKISADYTFARLGNSDRIGNVFLNGHFIRIEEHEGAFNFEVHSKDTHKFTEVTAAKPSRLPEETATYRWKSPTDSEQASAA